MPLTRSSAGAAFSFGLRLLGLLPPSVDGRALLLRRSTRSRSASGGRGSRCAPVAALRPELADADLPPLTWRDDLRGHDTLVGEIWARRRRPRAGRAAGTSCPRHAEAGRRAVAALADAVLLPSDRDDRVAHEAEGNAGGARERADSSVPLRTRHVSSSQPPTSARIRRARPSRRSRPLSGRAAVPVRRGARLPRASSSGSGHP